MKSLAARILAIVLIFALCVLLEATSVPPLTGTLDSGHAHRVSTAAILAAPTLVSPADGEAVAGGSVTFGWEAVEGAVDYLLITNTSTNPLNSGTLKLVIRVGNVTGYTDAGYPANGTRYYWWVWAYSAEGRQGAWSEVQANGRNIVNATESGPASVWDFVREEVNRNGVQD